MKLNKIIALCKKAKVIVIYNRRRDEDGEIMEQWIGDGAACYLVPGMPILDSESAGAILDIPAKDADKWQILERELPPVFDFTDDAAKDGETVFDEGPISFHYGGVMLRPLRSHGGAPLFIDLRYLTPFIDSLNSLFLYRRTAENGLDYVAVKVGMVLAGIIMPRRVENEEFVRELRTLAEDVERAFEAGREEEGGGVGKGRSA